MKVSIVITFLLFSFSLFAQGIGTYGGHPKCPMIFAKMGQAVFEEISQVEQYKNHLDLKKFQDVVKHSNVIVVENDGEVLTDYPNLILYISKKWCFPGVLDDKTRYVFERYLDLYNYELSR